MRCCCCCKIFAVSARIVAFHYQLRSWFGAFVDKFTEEHCIVKHCNALHCGVPVHCGKHCIVDQWAVERMQCVFWSTSALWSRVRRTGTENWNQIYLGLESNIFGGGYASFHDTEIFTQMMNFHQPVISSAASSWRSLLKDQHHCLQVIHNIISICWYILRLPQGEVKGKYWYILVNIGKYW